MTTKTYEILKKLIKATEGLKESEVCGLFEARALFNRTKKENIEKYLKKQYEILLKMQDKGFNAVACGSCGEAFLHITGDELLTCPFCEFNDEICEFPDLFVDNF